ncbi:MAG: dihydrofolate reductase family protein [Devosia sp.]|nr:dihydrofolate reductase family protein [Devosia sp.]
MRKVTAGLFHSLDGAVEAPHEWQFDRFDDELGGLLTGVLGRTDTVIMGRKGFSEWAGYWPNAEVDAGFADFINAVPKHVATRTLTTLPAWQNSSIIAGDLDTFVRELKAKDGGEIAVMASISVVNHLFLAGLLDELTLITHPVLAGGKYRKLFPDGTGTTRLELASSETTSKGNVVSTYKLLT